MKITGIWWLCHLTGTCQWGEGGCEASLLVSPAQPSRRKDVLIPVLPVPMACLTLGKRLWERGEPAREGPALVKASARGYLCAREGEIETHQTRTMGQPA